MQAQRINLPDKRPLVDHKQGGIGVQAQRRNLPGKRPFIQNHPGGGGVQAQRKPPGRVPHVSPTMGGRGVQAQRDQRPHVNPTMGGQGIQAQGGNDLLPWFYALAERLKRVVTLNRSWESAVTPSLLSDTATTGDKRRAIFMDPPYLTDDRNDSIYQSDKDGTSDDVARASWEWSVEHGEKYMIAYACHDGDFDLPDGWDKETLSFAGVRRKDKNTKEDCVMFSRPAVSRRRCARPTCSENHMKQHNFHLTEHVDGHPVTAGCLFRGGELADAFRTASRLRRFPESRLMLLNMQDGKYYQQACYKGRWRRMNVTL